MRRAGFAGFGVGSGFGAAFRRSSWLWGALAVTAAAASPWWVEGVVGADAPAGAVAPADKAKADPAKAVPSKGDAAKPADEAKSGSRTRSSTRKSAKAEPKPGAASAFIRITRDEKKAPKALETSIVRYVAGAGAADPRLSKVDQQGNTPLHFAAESGDYETVKELLAKGAVVDVANAQGVTPLHLAAKSGKKDLVKLLLDAPKPDAKGKPDDVVVDLIGVVHIGDKPYYDELNKIFTEYDAVLYELVAPPNTRIPKDAKDRPSNHPLGFLQTGGASALDLAFQLHEIDYQKKNLVHADMTPQQMADSMAKKGETIWTMMSKAMAQSAKQQANPKGNEFDLFMAFFADDQSLAMKRALAEQFENLEDQMAMFEGPDGSTIITERNKVCLQVLRKEMDAGKKKLAIFYGAGHMKDMAERLEKDFQLRRQGDRWLQAWDLNKSSKPAAKKAG